MQHGTGAVGHAEEEGGLQEAQHHGQHHQSHVDVDVVVQPTLHAAEYRVHRLARLVGVLEVLGPIVEKQSEKK